jgi:sigma-E factor negative regulatory protein RseC
VNQSEAVVARVDGEDAWLELCQPADCATCISAEGCGHSNKPRLQRVRNSIGARAGDRVLISIPDGAVVKAAMLSYLMPLVLGLLFAGVGAELSGEAGALVGLVAGLAVGMVALRFVAGRFARDGEPLLTMSVKPVVVQLQRNRKS